MPMPKGHIVGAKARKMKLTEAAWLAGLIDGEGSIINPRRSRGGAGVRLQLTMCNQEIIERVREVIGAGNISTHIPLNPKHSQSWKYYVHGGNAIRVLEQIVPWLIVKRELALDYIVQYTFTVDPS